MTSNNKADAERCDNPSIPYGSATLYAQFPFVLPAPPTHPLYIKPVLRVKQPNVSLVFRRHNSRRTHRHAQAELPILPRSAPAPWLWGAGKPGPRIRRSRPLFSGPSRWSGPEAGRSFFFCLGPPAPLRPWGGCRPRWPGPFAPGRHRGLAWSFVPGSVAAAGFRSRASHPLIL